MGPDMLRLITALTMILLLGGLPIAAQAQSPKQESIRSELSDEALKRLKAALELSKSGEPKAALDVLGTLASDIETPWQVRILVGELHEKSGNLAEAARFYKSITDELGDRVWNLPGNLYFRLSTVTFGLKDYVRSTPYLEFALRYHGHEDDSRIFEMLTVAYDQTSRPQMASRSMLLHAASDPKVRPAPSKLGAEYDNASLPPLPSVPDSETLRKLLALPPPTDPPSETNFPLSALSISYASALEAAGWKRAAERYKDAAYQFIFKTAATNIDEGSSNVDGLRELARLSALPGYDSLPPKLLGAGIQLEMQAHVNLGQFAHAAAALERLSKIRAYDQSNVTETAIKLQRLAFISVSFDMGSGQVRSEDPREFIDTTHLVAVAELAARKKRSKSAKKRETAAKTPYAAVTQSEDWAEVTAAVVTASQSPTSKRELIAILSKCLDDRTFELPVKFSLHLLASSFLDEKTARGVALRERLKREIYADGKPPRATTLDAYKAGDKLSALLK